MKASKTWHCSCCNETINPGEEFKIESGDILKPGHSTQYFDGCPFSVRGPQQPEATIIERETEPKKKEKDFLASHFIVCHVTEPVKKIKTEQLELLPVTRDYTKHKRELPEQQDIHDLPLFNSEYQKTEQLSLF